MSNKYIRQLISKLQISEGYLWIKYDNDLRPTIVAYKSGENDFQYHPKSIDELGLFGYFIYREHNDATGKDELVCVSYMLNMETDEYETKKFTIAGKEGRWFLNLNRYHKKFITDNLIEHLKDKNVQLEMLF